MSLILKGRGGYSENRLFLGFSCYTLRFACKGDTISFSKYNNKYKFGFGRTADGMIQPATVPEEAESRKKKESA